jgi:hypothetical protein
MKCYCGNTLGDAWIEIKRITYPWCTECGRIEFETCARHFMSIPTTLSVLENASVDAQDAQEFSWFR